MPTKQSESTPSFLQVNTQVRLYTQVRRDHIRRIYDALSNRLGAENDNSSDQQAIQILIRLHSEFKNQMSSLSSNDILRAVYRLYKQGLPISVKECDNH